MPITEAEVRKVARLALLDLTEEEVARYSAQLAAILGHFESVAEVEVAGVEGTSHAVPMDCPARPDAPGACLPRAEAMANAPRQEEGLFAVPRILAERE